MCWDELTALTSRIAAEVIADGVPEILIGILRGGVIPAVMLAHVLGSREVRAIEVTHTADDGINAAKTCRPLLRNLASAGDVSGRDVLITDDVAGTGETAAYTADLMRATESVAYRNPGQCADTVPGPAGSAACQLPQQLPIRHPADDPACRSIRRSGGKWRQDGWAGQAPGIQIPDAREQH